MSANIEFDQANKENSNEVEMKKDADSEPEIIWLDEMPVDCQNKMDQCEFNNTTTPSINDIQATDTVSMSEGARPSLNDTQTTDTSSISGDAKPSLDNQTADAASMLGGTKPSLNDIQTDAASTSEGGDLRRKSKRLMNQSLNLIFEKAHQTTASSRNIKAKPADGTKCKFTGKTKKSKSKRQRPNETTTNVDNVNENIDCSAILEPPKRNGFERRLQAEKIFGITTIRGTLSFLIKFKGTNKIELIAASIVNKEIPQMVIKYYEERLTWY